MKADRRDTGYVYPLPCPVLHPALFPPILQARVQLDWTARQSPLLPLPTYHHDVRSRLGATFAWIASSQNIIAMLEPHFTEDYQDDSHHTAALIYYSPFTAVKPICFLCQATWLPCLQFFLSWPAFCQAIVISHYRLVAKRLWITCFCPQLPVVKVKLSVLETMEAVYLEEKLKEDRVTLRQLS